MPGNTLSTKRNPFETVSTFLTLRWGLLICPPHTPRKRLNKYGLQIHWSWLCRLCKIDVSLNQLMLFFKIQPTISAIPWHAHESRFMSPCSDPQMNIYIYIIDGRKIYNYSKWWNFQQTPVNCQRVGASTSWSPVATGLPCHFVATTRQVPGICEWCSSLNHPTQATIVYVMTPIK